MDQKYYNVSYAESPFGTLNQYMTQTFTWMFAGLLTTFGVAIATVLTGAFYFLYATGLVFVLSIAELILVMVLSMRIEKLQPATATTMFFVYAVLTGINLSVYFIAYQLDTIILAFLVGAVYFGVMALYGAKTEKDLSAWGPNLLGGLVAVIIVSVLGALGSVLFHLSFGWLDVAICAVSIFIFMGFTAYDTQKLKYYYSYYGGDANMLHKSSIIGALSLYLDYINIFLYVLRLLGRSRRN